MHYIPYGRQDINEDDINAVIEVLKSDFLTTGPKVLEFEEKFAKYVGAKYAVAMANGTAALHIACLAAGIKEGDEVITSPITFAASANCVLYCGAKPVFADIDPITYNIDCKSVESLITDKTKAIIPVHYTGQPCDMDEIHRIAKKYNLIVIEDAAHAVGAEYKGKKIGALSDMTEFSFHPVKHITSGEGGIVTTNDEKLYEKLKLYRTHGITRNPDEMSKYDGPWYYEQIGLGYNYRITDFQCALGMSQLKRIDKFLKRRREIAKKYNEAFEKVDGITIPAQMEGTNSAYHLYVIKVDKSIRRQLFEFLRENNIGVNVHYIPVYTFPYYRENGYKDVRCENAEELYESIISLPMYYGLTDEEQDYVIEKVKSFL
ncbi:MAG: UDP-4-amino-4,6-dideoxy-N-acetyl-beta-L-altrosamine transaminase [Lachnospiraceae bacterium]|nr:UDP-4-amino-4,6-dideoxy-N-acetyl-beta-L-altrosamine transaminase [Lachnospiraceae bacterium]